VGSDGVIAAIKDKAEGLVPQVLPIHAEVEGMMFQGQFRKMLDLALSLGYRICLVQDIAAGLDKDKLSVRPLTMGLIPGRAFKCAV
jgi:hypothetical protein